MNKAKTNALDALRALISERQQYEQWMSTLAAKREGTPEHVYERVEADYRGRLDKVIADIRGHSEELQLSISTLSSRLVEVAREEDTRRESLQEAELRAAVGEYEPQQWEHLKSEAEQSLGKIAADRQSLDSQLGELRAIQKLSEVGSVGEAPAEARPGERGSAPDVRAPADHGSGDAARSQAESVEPAQVAPDSEPVDAVRSRPALVTDSPTVQSFSAPAVGAPPSVAGSAPTEPAAKVPEAIPAAASGPATRANERPGATQERLSLDSTVPVAANGAPTNVRQRSGKTPPSGVAAVRSRSEAAKPDQSKTLKCPECGSPNYPTEWYCEKCGGELATM